MPKRTRRLIFYCLILVFLVLGTTAVLYAQGWRASFEPFGLGKVGAVYIRTYPANAQVEINEKLKERKIGLFDKGTLLGNILPGEYQISVSSDGFHSWSMPVAVSSTLVTSLPNVVLVPDQATIVTSIPAKDILLVESTLIMETASGTLTMSGMTIPGGEVLAWSKDGSVIISYATGTREYFSSDVSRSTSTNLGRLTIQGSARTPISFESIPGDNTLFVAKGPTSLNLIRVPSADILTLATTSVTAAATTPGRVAWAVFDAKTNASLLSTYDILSKNHRHNFEFIPGRVTSLLLSDSGEIFALTEDGSLYSLNFSQSSRVRLARNVKVVSLSKSSDKLAVLDGDGINVLLLRGVKKDIQIPLSDAASVQKLSWHRGDGHLFIQYPDKVMFLDLIDTELNNFIVAAEASRSEYDPNANILYFLKEGVLYKLEFASS